MKQCGCSSSAAPGWECSSRDAASTERAFKMPLLIHDHIHWKSTCNCGKFGSFSLLVQGACGEICECRPRLGLHRVEGHWFDWDPGRDGFTSHTAGTGHRGAHGYSQNISAPLLQPLQLPSALISQIAPHKNSLYKTPVQPHPVEAAQRFPLHRWSILDGSWSCADPNPLSLD